MSGVVYRIAGFLRKRLDDLRTAFIESGILGFRRFGYIAGAAAWAISSGVAIYTCLDTPQVYTEFTAGHLGVHYENKARDYTSFMAPVAVFGAGLAFFASIASILRKRLGSDAESGWHLLVVVLIMPSLMALTKAVTSLSFNPTWFILASSILLFLACILTCMLLAGHAGRKDPEAPHRLVPMVSNILLLALVGWFGSHAMGLAVDRGYVSFMSHGFYRLEYIPKAANGLAFLFFLIMAAAALMKPDFRRMGELVWRGVFAAQFALPLLVLLLLPWEGGPSQNKLPVLLSRTQTPLWIFIALLAFAAYARILSSRKKWQRSSPPNLLETIPALSFILSSLLVKRTFEFSRYLIFDDYHFGEDLLSWWSFSEKGMLPFWDYAPARGLVNYIQGFVSQVFLTGIPESFIHAYPITRVILQLALFIPFRSVIGAGPAFLVMVITNFQLDQMVEVFVSGFIAYMGWMLMRTRPSRWVAIYPLASVAILLIGPGQGAVAAFALFPVFLFFLFDAYAKSDWNLFKGLAVVAFLMIVLILVTPLGKMMYGAFRYGLEQSSINSVAHSKALEPTLIVPTFNSGPINPWLLLLLRTFWIPVALIAFIGLVRGLLGDVRRRRVSLAFCLPVLILLFLITLKAMGRIDNQESRPWYASIWAATHLLPLLLLNRWASQNMALRVCVFALAVGPFANLAYKNAVVELYRAGTMGVTSGQSRPTLKSDLKERVFDSLYQCKQERNRAIIQMVDAVLDKDETYLDMTNRSSVYFHANRTPPMESAAIYNLVSEGQQKRAVQSIRKRKVAAVLIDADRMLFDNVTPSVRSHLVYRYIVMQPDFHYVRTRLGHSWLIRADRLSRIPTTMIDTVLSVQAAPGHPLDSLMKQDQLFGIASSWGRSAHTLSRKSEEIARFSHSEWLAMDSTHYNGDETYRLLGARPELAYDVRGRKLKGREAGLLSFDLVGVPPGRVCHIRVYWSAKGLPESEGTSMGMLARGGRNIVPLDAVPSWLLSDDLENIRLRVVDRTGIEEIRIGGVALLQRRNALAIP